MGNTAQDVIDWANHYAIIQYKEGWSPSIGWNNDTIFPAMVPALSGDNGLPWCAIFVSAAYWVNGVKGFPVTASVAAQIAYYKAAGRWTEYPVYGGTITFGNGEHCGLCVGWTDTTVRCLSGNTNSNGSAQGYEVLIRDYQRRDPYVTGYGVPMFNGPIGSADPKWQGHQFFPAPTPAHKPAPKPVSKPIPKPAASLSIPVASRDKLVSDMSSMITTLKGLK